MLNLPTLDLPIDGDGKIAPPKLLERFTTAIILSIEQFGIQPRCKGSIRLDLQFVIEGIRWQALLVAWCAWFSHMEIDKAPAQMGRINIATHLWIVLIGNQESEPKASQQTL